MPDLVCRCAFEGSRASRHPLVGPRLAWFRGVSSLLPLSTPLVSCADELVGVHTLRECRQRAPRSSGEALVARAMDVGREIHGTLDNRPKPLKNGTNTNTTFFFFSFWTIFLGYTHMDEDRTHSPRTAAQTTVRQRTNTPDNVAVPTRVRWRRATGHQPFH